MASQVRTTKEGDWIMPKKNGEKKEEKEESLLEELCRDDVKLLDFLSNYLLIDPVAAISKKNLDILTEEGDKSGDFRPAVDKAIFEGAQNPDERERYIKVIQNLALKTIQATEREKEKAEKKGLTDRASYLESRIENQKFMSERADDIISIASKFYKEELLELGENVRREEKRSKEAEAESTEWKIEQSERDGRGARKKEERGMGKEEKREAEKQDKRKELAAMDRKEARGEEKREAEREELRTEQLEEAARATRKKERRGN
jgi:hypothetical protein